MKGLVGLIFLQRSSNNLYPQEESIHEGILTESEIVVLRKIFSHKLIIHFYVEYFLTTFSMQQVIFGTGVPLIATKWTKRNLVLIWLI